MNSALIIRALAALSCAGVFAYLSALLPNFQQVYSGSTEFRRQAEALLAFSLALSDTPTALNLDLLWHNGVQQVWGLGVPLIRLPFELLAQGMGVEYFPDRLTPVLAALAAAWCLLGFFEDYLSGLIGRSWGTLLAWLLTLWLLCCPVFIALCQSRFLAYEEAVAFGYLWALLALALSGRALLNGSVLNFSLAALCLSFGPLIRPTMVAYSLPLAVVVLWYSFRVLPRAAWGRVLLLCGVGPLLLIVSNHLRFGDFWEFGHSLNLSSDYLNAFALRFAYPFQKAPLLTAAWELWGALQHTHLNGFDFYRQDLFPEQSALLRFRYFYFSSYGSWYLGSAIVSWAASLGLLFFAKFRFRGPKHFGTGYVILPLALVTITAAFLLTAFYLRFPIISSRYLVDFAPALALGPVLLLTAIVTLLHGFGAVTAARLAGLGLVLGLIALMASRLSQIQHAPSHSSAAVPALDKLQLQQKMKAWEANLNLFTWPTAYTCWEGDRHWRIFANTGGWAAFPDCRVLSLTQLYLMNPSCLSLEVEILGAAPAAEAISVIQVKVGKNDLVKKVLEPLAERTVEITFCDPKGRRFPGLQLVSIAWLDASHLGQFYPPFALHRIAVVD